MKTYAERAIAELIKGGEVKIDNRTYIYQDGRLLVRAMRTENGVESEVYLGGMCADMSLEYFLQYCEGKTFEDMIVDFPITIPKK